MTRIRGIATLAAALVFGGFPLQTAGVEEVPVFLVQGAEDLVTVPDVTRRYFDGISAPRAEFVVVPRAGHDPNPALIDATYEILTQRVRPLVEQQEALGGPTTGERP